MEVSDPLSELNIDVLGFVPYDNYCRWVGDKVQVTFIGWDKVDVECRVTAKTWRFYDNELTIDRFMKLHFGLFGEELEIKG